MEFLNKDTSELDRADPVANIRIIQEWLNAYNFMDAEAKFLLFDDRIILKVPEQIALAWSKVGITSMFWMDKIDMSSKLEALTRVSQFSALTQFTSPWYGSYTSVLIIDFTTQGKSNPQLLWSEPCDSISTTDGDVAIAIKTKSIADYLKDYVLNYSNEASPDYRNFRHAFYYGNYDEWKAKMLNVKSEQ